MKRGISAKAASAERAASKLVRQATIRQAGSSLQRQLSTAIAPTVRKLVQKETEKKYKDEAFVFNVAQEGTTSGSSGHALLYPVMPTQGLQAFNRIGNNIKLTSVICKFTVFSNTQAQTNTGISGRFYLVMYKDGGNFSIDEFLVVDPSSPSAQVTSRSLRNQDRMSDFIILAAQDFSSDADNYAANTATAKDYTVGWKGSIPIKFATSGTIPTINQLALVFVANSGSNVPTENGLRIRLNHRMYYTDA